MTKSPGQPGLFLFRNLTQNTACGKSGVQVNEISTVFKWGTENAYIRLRMREVLTFFRTGSESGRGERKHRMPEVR
jgi:hypothetical protein